MTAPAAAQPSGAWYSHQDVRVPAGWRVETKFEVFDGDTWFLWDERAFENPTGDPITESFELNLFAATGRRATAEFAPLGPGAPIVAQTAGLGYDPEVAVWLSANGFGFGRPYDSPVAIGDLNRDGLIDEGDGSLYALFDAGEFAPFAESENFPLDSIWETDDEGQVWPGLTFYLDDLYTTPYANSQILIVDISMDVPPSPPGIALLAVAALFARRRRA